MPQLALSLVPAVQGISQILVCHRRELYVMLTVHWLVRMQEADGMAVLGVPAAW